MNTTQHQRGFWDLFLDVQKLVLWIPARFSIDEEYQLQAKALHLSLRIINLYCALVFFTVIVVSVFTDWAGPWPSIRTFLIVLISIQIFKSIPVFFYLLIAKRASLSASQTHSSE